MFRAQQASVSDAVIAIRFEKRMGGLAAPANVIQRSGLGWR